jgi:hypothetical protein
MIELLHRLAVMLLWRFGVALHVWVQLHVLALVFLQLLIHHNYY